MVPARAVARTASWIYTAATDPERLATETASVGGDGSAGFAPYAMDAGEATRLWDWSVEQTA